MLFGHRQLSKFVFLLLQILDATHQTIRRPVWTEDRWKTSTSQTMKSRENSQTLVTPTYPQNAFSNSRKVYFSFLLTISYLSSKESSYGTPTRSMSSLWMKYLLNKWWLGVDRWNIVSYRIVSYRCRETQAWKLLCPPPCITLYNNNISL